MFAATVLEAIKPLNKQTAEELEATILKFDKKGGAKTIATIKAKNMAVKKTMTELMQSAAEVLPEGQTFIGKEPKAKVEKVAKKVEKDFTKEEIVELESKIGHLATIKPNVRLGLGDSVECVIVKHFFEKRSGRSTYQLKTDAIDQPVHTLSDNKELKIGKKADKETLLKYKLIKAEVVAPTAEEKTLAENTAFLKEAGYGVVKGNWSKKDFVMITKDEAATLTLKALKAKAVAVKK